MADPAAHYAIDKEQRELSELSFLLNSGTGSKREERRKAQEQQKLEMPPPTKSEIQVMAVQTAVDTLKEFIQNDRVVVGCFERWQALGYGPGRRQSAAEAGALAAIAQAMRAHPSAPLVQEKGALALANICSGTDEQGLARKAEAFASGCVDAVVAGMAAFPGDAPVLSNGSAALGNITCGWDKAGLDRKQAAFKAGAIGHVVAGMIAFPEDVAIAENGAFALGNLCRALGKVGNSSTGDYSAPELMPIEEQLKQRQEGAMRKQAAADAGALGALVAAMKTHASAPGVTEWGARALSIVTFESAPLRQLAKAAGAKMQWLMGLTENMAAAQNERSIPLSKTGRVPNVPGTGRPQPRALNSVRGF